MTQQYTYGRILRLPEVLKRTGMARRLYIPVD